MSTSERGAWAEIGANVFARRYPYLDQQIGAVIGDDSVLVIDTRSTASHARQILDDVRQLTSLPVSTVIDTHWHWDHAFGNATFRPAEIWGHVRTREHLVRDGERRRDAVAARLRAEPDATSRETGEEMQDVVIDPPDRTFDTEATVMVGGRTIELRYLGLGHTDADVVVLVPDAGVLFAGDLLEEGATPAFADSWPLDWPATVDRLLPLSSGAVVPGHGAVGDVGFVRDQASALRANAELARAVGRGEIGLEDAIGRSPWSPETARPPLERALAQLRDELGPRPNGSPPPGVAPSEGAAPI